MAKHVRFVSQDLELEGLWSEQSLTSAAVVTHPHPLYGGDMHNAVVETISKAYRNKGWSILRFNFRGAGSSDGVFDNGVGEQMDLAAAVDYLKTRNITDIELAGYSFGAWVMACWARETGDEALPMRFIAPPVGFIDFNPVHPIEELRQVIVGTGDEFAPRMQCESLLPQWNPKARFNVLEGADHFFWNQMDTLRSVLEADIPRKKN